MRDEWVLAVERAYAAAARGANEDALAGDDDARSLAEARAAAAAVASRYLAVGTPRSFGLVVGPAERELGALVLAAHRTWFEPRDLRCTDEALAVSIGARVVTEDEALAADIVCTCAAIALAPSRLRRGTHVNALGEISIDPELRALAMIADEARGLPALAAGLVDGRQLDEITVFVAGTAPIARAALRAIRAGAI